MPVVGPFSLGNDTVIVTNRAPVLDGDGNPTYDGYNRPLMQDVPTTVEGVAFELLSSDETNSNVNPTKLVGRAFLPFGTVISAQSRITWQGLDFEVFGPPRPQLDNDGQGDHIEVDCHREKG
ncbi:hypothetical protein [Nocardia pseudovaccinii]|uniref:hypothetical protein n=1 Tax=Nocardia pseudovaccinii TaxID=189540 RepID=UPI0007A46CFB|nr:hypothetical protein [Nocardia pseudovaccinii]